MGAKRFFAGDAVKDDFSHDEMPIYGKYYPEVVCEAESTEEVSAIMRVCYENDIPSRRAVRARASSAGACRCAAAWCCARRA